MVSRHVTMSLVLASCLAGSASAQIELRYKHKAGEKRTFVTEQKMQIKVNVNGMDIETRVDQVIEMTWETRSVDAKGVAQMEMRIDRVRMNVDSFGGSFEVDSEKLREAKGPIEKVLHQVVGAMASAKLKLKKDARGQISDVEVPEEVRKKLAALPDGGLGNQFDESTIRAMSEGGIVFPESIALGKTWEQTQKIDLPIGKLSGSTKYTYAGQEDHGDKKVEKITFVPDLKLEADLNAKVKVSIKRGEGKGTAVFDNKRGVLLEQTMEVRMEMETEVGGMSFTQNVLQNTTIRLKDGK